MDVELAPASAPVLPPAPAAQPAPAPAPAAAAQPAPDPKPVPAALPEAAIPGGSAPTPEAKPAAAAEPLPKTRDEAVAVAKAIDPEKPAVPIARPGTKAPDTWRDGVKRLRDLARTHVSEGDDNDRPWPLRGRCSTGSRATR